MFISLGFVMPKVTSSRFLSFLFFVALIQSAFSSQAQSDCDGTRYRMINAFDSFNVTTDVVYGNATNATGLNQDLFVDIYEPEGDELESRPLLIIAHGGFFIGGANDNPDVLALCQDLTRMGYVVGSITYRLGIDNFTDLSNAMVRSVWRGYHDGKAAVRYFRKTAEEDGNPWKIDPERIYLGGVSAGGFIALHVAYVDEESEIPPQVDQSVPGMGGGLEGESGNPGFSSSIAGVFNVAGGLKTAGYMSAGDEPVVSVHGTADETVPFGNGIITLSGVPITDVDGSSIIHEVADSLGIENCFTVLEGAGHVAHIGNPEAYFETLGTIAGALSSWLCDSYDPICGSYDFGTVDVAEWLQNLDGSWRVFPSVLTESEEVYIQWLSPMGVNWNYQMFDASGRLVKEGNSNGSGAAISTIGLERGLHIIRVQGSAEAHRIIIQ